MTSVLTAISKPKTCQVLESWLACGCTLIKAGFGRQAEAFR
jgi:hypothetical protein